MNRRQALSSMLAATPAIGLAPSSARTPCTHHDIDPPHHGHLQVVLGYHSLQAAAERTPGEEGLGYLAELFLSVTESTLITPDNYDDLTRRAIERGERGEPQLRTDKCLKDVRQALEQLLASNRDCDSDCCVCYDAELQLEALPNRDQVGGQEE